MAELLPSYSAEPAVAPVIKVIGLGDAGANLVAALADTGTLRRLVCNTDAAGNARLTGVDAITFGRKSTRGLSAGGEPERGRAAAEEDEAKFSGACSGAAVVFLVAGLGGGTGTGAAPVVARAAKRAGALVLAFVATPFEFEGAKRQRAAQAGIELLKHDADAVIVVPNERMLKLVDAAASLEEGFRAANVLLADGVRAVARLLTARGLIHLDFASLAAAVRGRHAESALTVAEAEGADRAKAVVEKLIRCPMLSGGEGLKTADAVLVSIVGGPDLTLGEVNAVMKALNHCCAKGNVTMGAVQDPAFAGKISVAIIATARGDSSGEEESAADGSESATAFPASGRRPEMNLDSGFVQKPGPAARRHSRIVPPAPELTPEQQSDFLVRDGRAPGRSRRRAANPQQQQLPLDVVSRGRFEKSEPTLHRGEDLDVPTFIRRGMVLN